MATYLFVGGGSFIGAYAIRSLLRDGHAVAAYDVNVHDNAIHRVLTAKELARVRFIQGDILDLVNLMHSARETKTDAVVSLAAALIPLCEAQPLLGARINVEGLNNVFEVARMLGLRRVVWASSIAVFGPQSAYPGEPADDAAHAPLNVYGVCKSMNEFMGHHYFRQFGVDNIGLRFTVVYGPHRLRGALAYRLGVELLEKPAHNQPGKVPVGDAFMNWQYVEDAAQAILAALRHEGPTETRVFNTGGEALRVREAAAAVRSILPDADLAVEPGESQGIHQLSIAGAEKELGYHPAFSFAKGARATINQYRSRQGLPPVP